MIAGNQVELSQLRDKIESTEDDQIRSVLQRRLKEIGYAERLCQDCGNVNPEVEMRVQKPEFSAQFVECEDCGSKGRIVSRDGITEYGGSVAYVRL